MNHKQPPLRTLALLSGLGAFAFALPSTAHAQGCMATRVSPPTVGSAESGAYLKKGQTDVSVSFRYYEAKRHFYDTNDEIVPANAPRVERFVVDASVTRGLTDRTSVTVSVPIQSGKFDRSPIPPYGASTDKATGLGDVAVTFRRWMLDTTTHSKYNFRLGIGAKLPTGKNDAADDRRYNIAPRGQPANYVTGHGPVDMAIQPGDGGFGIILSGEGFYQVAPRATLYGELTYLINPRGENGVNNQWSGAGPYVPNNTSSVPDYFLGRAGVAYAEPFGAHGFSAQLGLRIEGQPVRDLIGSNAGFRRPGYSLSVEPGLVYGKGNWNVFLTVPITIYRMRWKSVDEERAGYPNAVSAAFADYNILTGISRRF